MGVQAALSRPVSTVDPFSHEFLSDPYPHHVGQAVARLETEAILTALAKRVELFELTVEPTRRLNNTLCGFDTLPLRIVPV